MVCSQEDDLALFLTKKEIMLFLHFFDKEIRFFVVIKIILIFLMNETGLGPFSFENIFDQ